MRREVEKTNPYDYNRMSREKYSLQDMLIDQYNFPMHFHDGDFIMSDWTDRVDTKRYRELADKHFKDPRSWEIIPPARDEMMSFLQDYYNEELTGYRLVRFTNQASQFPVYRIDLFRKSDGTPEEATFFGSEGPNIIGWEERRQFDLGMEMQFLYREFN